MNFTGILAEIRPWPQRVQCLLLLEKRLGSGVFVGHDLINDYSGPHDWFTITRSRFEVWCSCSFILQCFLHKFQGPEHVETMWQRFTGRRAGTVIKAGAKLGRSLLFQGLPLFFSFNSPLKMCVAYCEQQQEIRVLTNGWLTFFCVAKRLVAQTRDFYVFCKAALCIPFPKTVP